MIHPFDALAPEYADLLSRGVIDPSREAELEARFRLILDRAENNHGDEWKAVTAATGVPMLWGIPSFERESSSDYSRSPAQGDRWDRPSVNVPRGLGPYPNWGASAVAAYRIDHLNMVTSWTWPRAMYEGELFNGFGPRNHGKHTGYLWAWSNIYTGGKYVSDGVWDPNAHDQQCGMVPMMLMLLRLDPSLSLVDNPAAIIPTPIVSSPGTVPLGLGGGEHDAAWIQRALNRKGAHPPLVVDGSFGRITRRAVVAFQSTHGLAPDGVVGPLTIAALAA